MTIISSFYFLRIVRYWIHSVENHSNFRFLHAVIHVDRTHDLAKQVFSAHSSNALAWPLTVAFACANWQIVTVIHKWADSRPREQGHHSILHSRRGHLIVIIVMLDAAPRRHSHAYHHHQEVTRRVDCMDIQKREPFPRVGSSWSPSSLLPMERLTKSFMFAFFVELSYFVDYLVRDKWKALFFIVEHVRRMLITWRELCTHGE